MIMKDLIDKLPPIVRIGNIVQIWYWNIFKWHIYFIVEKKPVKISNKMQEDLKEMWRNIDMIDNENSK